ncbi:hypothetical protein BAC1_02205 [uncultured bacterium]|nr:hypothetical protein BAC1_02205 [uncultured bacterium]
MVLSGFLFTFGAAESRVNYFGFIWNRVLRIYPLFLLMIVIGAALYPSRLNLLGFLETVFFMANLPDALALGPVTALFWSISVEFQFYLIFPFLLFLLRRYGVLSLVLIMAAALFLRAAAVYAGYNVLDIAYLSMLARIDQFLLGMIAAKIFSVADRSILSRFFFPSIAGVLSISLLFNRLGGWFELASWRVVWPLVEGAAWSVFLLSYTAHVRNNTNIIGRALSRIGEISYSVYLMHFSVWWYFCVANKWFLDLGAGPLINALANSFLIILPVTVVLSTAAYMLVEKPFLSLRIRYLR